MANKVTVIDAAGVQRKVHTVDAREIVEAGGQLVEGHVAPLKEKPKKQHPAEVKPVAEPEAVEIADESPKAKAKSK